MNDTLVVLNDEEQYSIWSAGRPIPAGWRPEGFAGTRGLPRPHRRRLDRHAPAQRARGDGNREPGMTPSEPGRLPVPSAAP